MMSYRYLVGYVIQSQRGESQIGNAIITRSKPILNSKDVADVEVKLQKDFSARKIVLLSFSKLEGVD